MAFTFEETPESRAQSYSEQGDNVTLIYKAVGEQNDAVVREYAATTGTPGTVTGLTGILYRKEISLRPDGFRQYYVEVPYGRLDKTSIPRNSYTFSFDTTGKTTNVKVAKAHIKSYPTDGNFHKGVIGVKQDGSVDGADIIIPGLRLSFAFKFPSGIITANYVKNLSRKTGTVNLYRFLGFEPGELLFMGATGENGSEVDMTVNFAFEASENAIGITTGGITNVDKKGHEYLWHEFGDEVDSGVGVTRAKRVHVEQVYDPADFDSAFGWNIFTRG